MFKTAQEKRLVVWIDDLMESTNYGPRLQPLKDLLSSNCELVKVATLTSLAAELQRLAAAQRRVDGILIDMMLTSLKEEKDFSSLGVDSVSIKHHAAGAQLARILIADQYRNPDGETPAAEFLEHHRGCSIAVISTCYENEGAGFFASVDAQDIQESVFKIYDASRQFEPTRRDLLAWLATLG